jgi:hypothetical protein
MNVRWFLAAGFLVGVVVVMPGCGGAAYEYDSFVSGTVTIDGNLANSGTVTFHPVKEGKAAIGRIHSDGSYSLRTGQGDLRQVDGGTLMPGEYLVTASITGPPTEGAVLAEGGPPIPGPSLIASKYAQKGTTDLRVTVKPGRQVIVLNLDPAEPQPADGESAESPAAEAAVESEADGEDTAAKTPPASSAPTAEQIDDAREAASEPPENSEGKSQ